MVSSFASEPKLYLGKERNIVDCTSETMRCCHVYAHYIHYTAAADRQPHSFPNVLFHVRTLTYVKMRAALTAFLVRASMIGIGSAPCC